MQVLASQNLYGVLQADGTRVSRVLPVPALSNGLCAAGDRAYLAGWSDVHVVDRLGRTVEVVHTRALNCHTLRLHAGRLLIASTADASVVWGDETVFRPGDHGLRPVPPHGFYLNAAIPWRDDTVLVGLRSHRLVVFYDLAKRRIERAVHLPYLRNLHHPTPYAPGLFLVSDDDAVVLFGPSGRQMLRSPEFRWPRGIWVESPTRVWVADRNSVSLWNPEANAVVVRIRSPVPPPSSLPGRREGVWGGALFDVVGVGDDFAVGTPAPDPARPEPPAAPGSVEDLVERAMAMAEPARTEYLASRVGAFPGTTAEEVLLRVRDGLALWKGATRFGHE